ncbi:hypothetical protein ACFVP8_08565 [Viridibacillus arvi]|uniref:hypothetical protein n=1 Tax=Viridibacillus arvi TaxID=263475 RepID=UPI003687CC03
MKLAIGLFTQSPVLNFYVASSFLKTNIIGIFRGGIPLIEAAIIVLMLITYAPVISTFLPDLLGVK